jgi:hypothetical protein
MDEYDKLGPYSILKYYSMQTYIVFFYFIMEFVFA